MAKTQLKPVIKWAGGKGQLLKEISDRYPEDFGKTIDRYAEPFIGGGAVLLDILSKYDLKEVYISDINAELVNMYCMIRDNVEELIALLKTYEDSYVPKNETDRKEYYYQKRNEYNELIQNGKSKNSVESAALFIFLNHTCFNGLYRVNRKGLFNVPMGSYKNPTICDDTNLRSVSKALKNVQIVCGDFRESLGFIDDKTLVYFDPPYRPLTTTANFTSYTEYEFNDDSQKALAEYVKKLASIGVLVIVSNSDPKNSDPDDEFFDEIYSGLNINRISATRMINSNAGARGKISELLICNF